MPQDSGEFGRAARRLLRTAVTKSNIDAALDGTPISNWRPTKAVVGSVTPKQIEEMKKVAKKFEKTTPVRKD